MKTLVEGQKGNGAVPLNKIHRLARRLSKPVAMGNLIDWSIGYDVRHQIGEIKIKDQGTNYSCGGQAGAYMLEIQRRLQNIKEGAISAKSIYAQTAAVGGGVAIDKLEGQICWEGAELETTVPSYDINGNPLQEYMMIEKSWLTPNVATDELTRAGYVVNQVSRDIDSVASAIQAYGAVILEIRGQNNGTWLSYNPTPPSKLNSNPYWYHYIIAVGYKMMNGQKYLICLNSWGTDVGNFGEQVLDEDYFLTKNVLDAVTFIYDKYIAPLPDNHSLIAEILRWFRRTWGLSVA